MPTDELKLPLEHRQANEFTDNQVVWDAEEIPLFIYYKATPEQMDEILSILNSHAALQAENENLRAGCRALFVAIGKVAGLVGQIILHPENRIELGEKIYEIIRAAAPEEEADDETQTVLQPKAEEPETRDKKIEGHNE
jgi:hypothetical protein